MAQFTFSLSCGCVYIYVYVSTHICMSACAHICMYVCMTEKNLGCCSSGMSPLLIFFQVETTWPRTSQVG